MSNQEEPKMAISETVLLAVVILTFTVLSFIAPLTAVEYQVNFNGFMSIFNGVILLRLYSRILRMT